MDEGRAFAALLRGIVPSATKARDRTTSFTADAVVALRMAEEGPRSPAAGILRHTRSSPWRERWWNQSEVKCCCCRRKLGVVATWC